MVFIVKESSCNTLIKLYSITKIFIETVNTELTKAGKKPTYYQEFKWLAKCWEDSPVKNKRRGRFFNITLR